MVLGVLHLQEVRRPRQDAPLRVRQPVEQQPVHLAEPVPERLAVPLRAPADAKGAARQINAPSETLEERPALREACRERRCIVPADGFFEWTGPKENRHALWFHRPDGRPLFLAGLYEYWQPRPDEWERTFTIVTTGPNQLLAPIHDRMPVILLPGEVDEWLYPGQELPRLRRLLRPAPEDFLEMRTVSSRVNSVRNDDPSVLEPVAALL